MPFNIDFSKFRLVDMSLRVIPNNMPEGRPFNVKESNLPDGTWKFDIVETHTHVGTHIESPWHFYHEGHTCTDYPLEKFMGPTALLKGNLAEGEERVPLDAIKAQLEPLRGQFRNLYVRNDTAERPLRFDPVCIDYFADFGLDIFAFDATIEFGQGLEDGKHFHDALLSRDTLLAEFLDNGQAIDQDLFYMFAVPLNIHNLDSSACRIFAVLEK